LANNSWDDPEDLAIVEGIIGLAHAFHRQVDWSAHDLPLLTAEIEHRRWADGISGFIALARPWSS